MFINNKFIQAIDYAGAKIREDHYDYIEMMFDEITPYGWECHCENARRLEDKNTSDVLRRHYGKVGTHDRVYGFCYNPILKGVLND